MIDILINKMRIFIIFFLLNICNAFHNSKLWNLMNKPLKEKARIWFINRAEKKGIKWKEITDFYRSDHAKKEIHNIFNEINNIDINYPEYYTKSFHGYDEGNLNWLAAYENEASIISMSSGYYKNVSPEESSLLLRTNFNNLIYNNLKNKNISNILDLGCSIGISTEFIKNLFPNQVNIIGLDLSPYFISIGKFNSIRKKSNINYIHANAEKTNLDYNSFDLICSSFMFHELPPIARNNILEEIYKLLSPGGIVAILDLDPKKLKLILKKDNWKKIAFESTEPHINSYYKCDMLKDLKNNKFNNIKKQDNDPYNSVWIATK